MPALLIQNATSRTLGFVLHGNDDAVVAELDAVRPGAAWTYSFEGDLVLKTLEVSVHPATGACARAATCLNAAVHKLSSSAALSDPPRENAVKTSSQPHRDRFGPLRIVGSQKTIVRIQRDGRCELALQRITEDRSECVIA